MHSKTIAILIRAFPVEIGDGILAHFSGYGCMV